MSYIETPRLGETSTDNSSTSAINTGANFTGTWEDVEKYESIVVAVKTDQNGYFEIQYSPDGVNADSTLTRYYKTAQIEAPHRFTNTRRYMRVIFYNDSGTNQTYFRLQTTLGLRGDLNAPLDSTLAQDFDSISVRPSDFHTEVALGKRQGSSTWNKFGYNLDVASASAELIASWGGAFQYLTTGETIDVVSDSANDVVTTGTGAQSIVVYGVDSNWDEQTEIINMNGLTTVTTTSTWIGINRISIYLAGTGKQNAGTISVTATTAGYDMAEMPATQGTSQQMIFYVAQKCQFLAEWLHFNALKTSGGGKPEVNVLGYVYSAVSNAEYEIYRGAVDIAVTNDIDVAPPVPFVIGEKSILWFNCDTDTNNTSIKGRFSGELVRDVDG